MTIRDDSFPSPEIAAPGLSRRRRLAILSEGAAPARTSTATSISGAFERMEMGGVGGAVPVPVTYGKCVIVVHEDITSVSNCTVCGVGVGQAGKLCVKEGCSIAAHVTTRANMDLVLKVGIYVWTSSSGTGVTKVYSDPVGSISIFKEHQFDILAVEDTEPGEWNLRFNTWGQSANATIADTILKRKARAKILQTPKKILPTSRADFSTVFQNMNPLTIEDSILVQTNLSLYEKSW